MQYIFLWGRCCEKMSSYLKGNYFVLMLLSLLVLIALSKSDHLERYPEINNLISSTSLLRQQKAVEELIARKLGKRARDFLIFLDPNVGPTNKNTFKIQTNTSTYVSIVGNNAISASWGFHYYLTNVVGAHISWDGEWLDVPAEWPFVPGGEISITSNDKFRYMENMCTFSYSYQWYDWQSWEKHIDWMALNAINLPLASSGQEEIWRRVFMKLGFSLDEIQDYFTGSAFLAWNRMGNIKKWGGQISIKWLKDQASLQAKILERMRDFSMLPIIPAFAGFVPEGMTRLYPQAKTYKLPSWNKFNSSYSNLLLDSEDQLFQHIGTMFLEEYTKEFGTDHVYSSDTFNEMAEFGDITFIASYGRAVFNAMEAVDKDAIWVMQGWIFQDVLFWTQARAKALLKSVPLGRMIVLDLFAEEQPRFSLFQSFYGQPYIWCMLHNFGGASTFYGVIDMVNEGPLGARHANDSTMIGIGLAPEAIDQNYVIYEFMLEHTWIREKRDIDKWIAGYTSRRYGVKNDNLIQAWRKLVHSVYNFTIANRLRGPSFTHRPNLHMKPSYWYQPSSVFKAWDLFIDYALSSKLKNPLYEHDLVDLSRQAMEIIIMDSYHLLIRSYNSNKKAKFRHFNHTLISAISDLDWLLQTNQKFLLGCWISNARKSAGESEEKDQFEFNARNQLTLWGPNGNVLDYAAKQWSGLIESYYLKRWILFTGELSDHWALFNQSLYNEKVIKEVEMPFCNDKTAFPDKPSGDPITRSLRLYEKYRFNAKLTKN